VLLVPSFHRYEMVAELVRETVRLRDAARLQTEPRLSGELRGV
jgi:hypothetical protein